jgi:hypothetical protein
MNGFLYFFLGIQLLDMAFKLIFLAKSEYPRVRKNSRGDDALSIFLSLLISVWVLYVLGLLGGAS